MPIDPSIALGFQMPQLMTPMQAQTQAMNLKDLQAQTMLRQQQVQQGQQSLKNQQQLSQLASDRSNVDPETGYFTQDAINQIGDPMLRQKMSQDRMGYLYKKSETDRNKSTEAQANLKLQKDTLKEVWEPAYVSYENRLKSNPNDKQGALDSFNKEISEGYDEIRKTGKGNFPKDFQFNVPTPEKVYGLITTEKEREETARAEQTPFMKEAAAIYGKDSPEYKKALQEHVSKMDAPARTTINMGGPPLSASQEALTGEDFLKTLHTSEANQVRAIGEGRMLLQDVGVRGPARERLAKLVAQAYPSYDSGDAKTNRAIEVDFAKGKPSQSLQSINAVTEHMETYRNLAKALDNGDTQIYNKYKNDFEKATGKTLPNDLAAAAPIVGSEIVKAIVPAGGSMAEREEAQKQWSTALSNKQAQSQIDNVYLPLMRGQVDGLRQRYQASGKKDFDTRFLTQSARKSLNIGGDENPNKPQAGMADRDKAAVAWAKSNPNDPRAKKIMEMNGGL